jgi:hypothetical protein
MAWHNGRLLKSVHDRSKQGVVLQFGCNQAYNNRRLAHKERYAPFQLKSLKNS